MQLDVGLVFDKRAPGFNVGDQVGGTRMFSTMFAQAVVYFGIGKQLPSQIAG
jgi:hypothetical protein